MEIFSYVSALDFQRSKHEGSQAGFHLSFSIDVVVAVGGLDFLSSWISGSPLAFLTFGFPRELRFSPFVVIAQAPFLQKEN